MTFLWEQAGRSDPEERRTTALRSRRGVLQVAVGNAGWLLLIPLVWYAGTIPYGGSVLGLTVLGAAFVFAVLVSLTAVLIACMRSSWAVALVTLILAAGAVVVVVRLGSQMYTVDGRYRAHRAALADLAEEYRAGRLDGELTLPPALRSLSPSGFAYAGQSVLFVQTWQNWRAESGTGLAYFVQRPDTTTSITTASGDTGRPLRMVGGGWWWVA